MKKNRRSESGQGAIAYALILSLVAAAVLLALNALGIDIGEALGELTGNSSDGEPESCYATGFDEGTEDWSTHKKGFWRGKWDTQDGQLCGSPLGVTLLDGFSGSDFTLDLGSPNLENVRKYYNGFGVMFRASLDKKGRLIGYMFEIEKKGRRDPGLMYFSKWIKGKQIFPPIASVPVPKDFNWSKPGDMRVVVKGNTFTAYIDGTEVLKATDDLYSEGGVGVAANWGSKLCFDDFSIEAPDCGD